MKHGALIFAILISFIAGVGAPAHAGDVTSRKVQGTTAINGLAISSTRYTGWVLVDMFRMAVFDVTFVDANDSVTALSWVCYESDSASTANGSGFEVCATDTSSGTTTYTCPWTGTITTGTAESFTFGVTNLKHDYINCAFSASGTPGSADLLTVATKKVTP